jgi:hypothetical protein
MDEIELTRAVLREPHHDVTAARAAAASRLDLAMRPPSDRRGRRLVAVAALIAAAVVLALPVTRMGRPAVADELERIAMLEPAVLADIPPGTVLHREFRELRREERSDIVSGATYGFVVEVATEEWIGRDRSAVRIERVRAVSLPTDADRAAWVAAGEPPLPRPGDVREIRFEPGEYAFVPSERVPSDPEALEAALRSGSIANRPTGDRDVFLLIGDLLAQHTMPAPTRDALLDVATQLDGIVALSDVRDPLGRPGTAFAVNEGSAETQLIFDPSTGTLLAWKTVSADGSETSWGAYLVSELVDAGAAPK